MKKNPLKLKLVLVIIAIFLISLTLINNIILGNSKNYISFGLINFMGYLFFFFLPSELFYIYYLNVFNPIYLFIITLITAILGFVCDYILGYLFSNNIKYLINPKKINKYKNYLKNYNYLVIFIFVISPLSSPVIILISGIMKLKFKYIIIISFFGLIIKYILLILIFGN